MKLIPILLLLSLGAKGQVNPRPVQMPRSFENSAELYQTPTHRDTVKCRVVVVDERTSVLYLAKAWLIREHWPGRPDVHPLMPWIKYIKYLHPNKRDSLSVIGDFKPIIQEWR